jgi:dTDP-4-amino-4,6-dideoxygalactose transaminase
MNDFKAEARVTRDETLAAVARVLDSGWYVLGTEVETFEGEWAKMSGVRRAVGVGNGMDAIEIALRVLGIGPGDEVITTPMTAFASVLAIIRAGATPVLADIHPGTGLLSMPSVASCVNTRTKGVVLVHLYGQIRDCEAWKTFCAERGIHLIEDCAQAHLATLGGAGAGSFGPVAAFSFYPTKNLGAIGDAGAIVTNDDRIAERAKRLRNYGQSVRYHHPELGMNSRLDELQAAILLVRLSRLRAWTERRQTIARAYFDRMKNPHVRLMDAPVERGAHVYHLFVVTCDDRDGLAAHLKRRGVQSLIHYPVPIHHQETCRGLARASAGLAASERHAATCLSVPCHPQMSDTDVTTVIDGINAFQPTSA